MLYGVKSFYVVIVVGDVCGIGWFVVEVIIKVFCGKGELIFLLMYIFMWLVICNNGIVVGEK